MNKLILLHQFGSDMHSECRPYILFQDLQEEDWVCVRKLIELESKFEA